MDGVGNVTLVLRELSGGDRHAFEKLIPLLYSELHERAEMQMRREKGGRTMTPTVLVHEAYSRLAKQNRVQWNDRIHFLAVASLMMRRVLLDYYKKRKRPRRELHEMDLQAPTASLDEHAVVAEALERLAAVDERQARVVDMRVFAKMTSDEIARELGVSVSTVEREWKAAKAWLKCHFAAGDEP